ncbi:DUF86 domain-containing protein [Mucilaginibacter terrigena]|uniref:DUF86 domain-containing protein n=1 Tax=Mucilaginibacter terrigena TaxID=2492395 RepID=A0A4Q5LRY6_9SPHI|nr:HepT-like ribonuclease domain-containing protein [Mucilaginibacter terrigena]RYU92301.1 DUF86 domain-containing protein [Mucilaginibacter terrigena]
MQREVKKYLFDILSCVENIENFIGGKKVYSAFESNLMLQQAVERNIEIIGEAVNNLLKINPEIAITSARRMVDARNKIIHGYDEIQLVQIWNIVVNHLPLLKNEVEKLLN